MKKQKTKIIISALFAMLFAGQVSANGNATVSWTAPTTNEGSAANANDLVDLAGYRIFYSGSIDIGTFPTDLCTEWDAVVDRRQSGLGATALWTTTSHVDVTEAATIRDTAVPTKRGYTFSTGNLLSPGNTYYFTVVAYDTSGNYSKCINDSGLNRVKSKLIFHSGNIKNGGLGSGTVGISDISILAGDWNKGVGGVNPWCRLAGHSSDINGDCKVNISDLSILAGEWLK
jgi:hypothetical protein